MNLLRALPAILATVLLWSAVGNRAVARFSSGLSRSEAAGWSFAAGLLGQAAVYSGFLLFSASPGPRKMAAAAVVLFAVFAILARREKASSPHFGRLRPAAVVMLLISAIGVAIFAVLSMSEPMWGKDFLAIWGFKGKTIFLTSSVPARLFHDPATLGSHPEYPLLLPLIFASFSASVGAWNDQALAILYPLFELGLLFSIFGFLRRRSTASGAAAACLIVAWFFPLFHPYHVGMAEIPLAFALVLFAEAALDSSGGPGAGALLRTAIASLFCCGLKPEGSLFVLLTCVGLAASSRIRRSRAPWATFLFALFPLALHAAILRAFRGAVSGRDSDWCLLLVPRWGELLQRIARSSGYLVSHEIVPRALPLAAFLALFLLTRSRRADVLLVPVAAQVILYAAVCALSTVDPIWQVKTAFARVAAALFPLCAIPIGERLSLLLAPAGDPGQIG